MPNGKVVTYTGQPAPISGQYRAVGSEVEYTLARGNKTPPNRYSTQQRFVLVDRSKHKS